MRRRTLWAVATTVALVIVAGTAILFLAQRGSFSTRDHVVPVYHRYPRGSATYSG